MTFEICFPLSSISIILSDRMLRMWLPKALALGLALTPAAVHAANPLASQLWTLVGCDGVDLDGMVSNVADLEHLTSKSTTVHLSGTTPETRRFSGVWTTASTTIRI